MKEQNMLDFRKRQRGLSSHGGLWKSFFHISERHDQIQKDLPDRWIYGISRKEKTEKAEEDAGKLRLCAIT